MITMHDANIELLKPASIFEIIPCLYFDLDTVSPNTDYIRSGRYYEYYYAIAKYVKPQSIMEIGVCLGFSLLAMMEGAGDDLRLAVGFDIEAYVPNSNTLASEQIDKFYKGPAKLALVNADSQLMTTLRDQYDLIHVDGDHSVEGALHDLELTVGRTKWVIVDDYDNIESVKVAVHRFIMDKSPLIESSTYLSTLHGAMLIHYV